GGAHGIGGMDLFYGYRFDASACCNGHRGENGQEDQKYLGEFTDAEPDDDQRQVGQWRQRSIELDDGVENPARQPVDAHEHTYGHGGKQRQYEGAHDSAQAGDGMLQQRRVGNTYGAGFDELVVDGERRRQEYGFDHAQTCHDKPQRNQ